VGGLTALGAASDSVVTNVDLDSSLDKLEAYLVGQRYRGWDPYDALMSPLFRLPVLRSSKWIRVGAEQALKRLPFNIRPLLGIAKGYNPVTLAFVLEGSVYRAATDPERVDVHRARARECIAELERLQTRGYSGACWGYDFDWEARYGRLPRGTPTIVATGLVTNALFVARHLLGLEDAFALCESAARFVLRDVPRAEEDDGTFCWAYHPGDDQRVINASLKGARLCAQVWSVTGDDELQDAAYRTATNAVRHQRVDGSWPYALGDRRDWADNFHTAYVLDALETYSTLTEDYEVRPAIRRGWDFYRSHFFHDGRVPKYYSNALLPVDATACAQSLVTLCRFGDVETAARVAEWTVDHLQCDDGHIAYQQRRRRVVRIPYMRWSSAYMYFGLSRLAHALAGHQGPP
jgi:hypothetical protein